MKISEAIQLLAQAENRRERARRIQRSPTIADPRRGRRVRWLLHEAEALEARATGKGKP